MWRGGQADCSRPCPRDEVSAPCMREAKMQQHCFRILAAGAAAFVLSTGAGFAQRGPMGCPEKPPAGVTSNPVFDAAGDPVGSDTNSVSYSNGFQTITADHTETKPGLPPGAADSFTRSETNSCDFARGTWSVLASKWTHKQEFLTDIVNASLNIEFTSLSNFYGFQNSCRATRAMTAKGRGGNDFLVVDIQWTDYFDGSRQMTDPDGGTETTIATTNPSGTLGPIPEPRGSPRQGLLRMLPA